ncbi:hypothetical protein DMUE_4495 [Dictyocoela muelleri]|nr:hypothetical protein DMUE_4495 [Dictyocoela muelleri]
MYLGLNKYNCKLMEIECEMLQFDCKMLQIECKVTHLFSKYFLPLWCFRLITKCCNSVEKPCKKKPAPLVFFSEKEKKISAYDKLFSFFIYNDMIVMKYAYKF